MVQTTPSQQLPEEQQNQFIPQQSNNSYILPTYQQPSITEFEIYYDFNSIYQVEISNSQYPIIIQQNSQDQFFISSGYFYRWMPILSDLEKELKSIVMGKANLSIELSKYLNTRIIPLIDSILSRLFQEAGKLKIQCYCNELLLWLQALSFQIWKQHPQLVLTILKKIFCTYENRFFNSQFDEQSFVPTINNFYGERLVHKITSQHTGYPRPDSTQIYNSQIFYPLQNEILESHRKQQNAYYLSPFFRIQIHYFYKNGGLELLADGVQNFSFQNLDVLEILSFFQGYLDAQIYKNYFMHIKEPLLNIYSKINEEDLKYSSKEAMRRLSDSMERVLQPFYLLNEVREHVALIEMNIFLQCLKCQFLEKRIFGMQQICDKINTCQDNELLNKEYASRQDEWYMPENMLNFLVSNQIFQIIFGEKAHFELIKRSFPLIKFLYKHNQLKQDGILNIMRMCKGKHESWSNMIYKILNDLAEILSEPDMDFVLMEIKEIKIDQNALNFIKSLGKNQQFDKKQIKLKQNKQDNLLEELEKKDEEENIGNIDQNKGQLVIKVIKVNNGENQQFENNTYPIRTRQPGQRKYQDQDQFNEDIKDEETSCEEGEGIRGRIVEFLLQIVHDQQHSDVGKQAFNISCQMICGQFRSLRFKYLTNAFSKLFENDPPLPITNYITMIQKIIQSSYPLDEFKSQQELIKWLDSTYNYKLSLLAVLGKTKRKYLEDDQTQYLEMIDSLLKFYQFLFQASDNKIEAQHIKIIWQIMVENAITQLEQDAFFVFIYHMNKILLGQDALQLIFFDYLIKVDYNSYSIHMFNCLTNLITYFNVQYRIFKSDQDSYTLLKPDLIGIEIVWKLFFECQNQEIINKAQSFLLSILKFKVTQQQTLKLLKEQYVNKLFEFLKNDYRSLDFLLKIIEDSEGIKFNKNDKGDKFTAIVDNKCKGAFPPKKQEMTFYSNMTVLQAKQQISNKLNPIIFAEDIDIVCQGIWLDNNKTLKDYNYTTKVTFIIYQKSISDEDAASSRKKTCEGTGGTCGSSAPPIPLGPALPEQGDFSYFNMQPTQEEMNQKIQQVSTILDEQDHDFIKFVLEKKGWNEEQVLTDLLDDDKKIFLKVEFQDIKGEEQKKKPQQKIQQINQYQQQENIAQYISQNSQFIQQFFDILNLNHPEVTQKVWNILQLIPRNKETYDQIDQALKDADWEYVADLKNHHKLYYNLQILKELLECDFVDDLDECKKRQETREKFLVHGGLESILELLLLDGLEQNIISLSLQIYQIFFNAYACSQISNIEEFNKLVNLKETIKDNILVCYQDKNKQTKSNSRSDSVSSKMTPTFDKSDEFIITQKQQINQDEQQTLIESFKNNKDMRLCINKHGFSHLLKILINHIQLGLEQVFSLILCILYIEQDLLEELKNTNELQQQFLNILINNQSEELRKIVQFTILTICQFNVNDIQYEMDEGGMVFEKRKNINLGLYFLNNYLPLLEQGKAEYEEFYSVLAILIEKEDPKNINISTQKLFEYLANFIKNREIIEERFGENEDKMIQGHLVLLKSLLIIEPEMKTLMAHQLTQQLYYFLFDLKDDYQLYPKFKRRMTRKKAFDLLVETCKQHRENIDILINPISNNHERFEPNDLDMDTGVKGIHGYVGLKNLGATCYINSLLQQFFMNKSLRQGILNGQIKLINKNNEQFIFDNIDQTLGNRKRLAEHTLHQLQLVFIDLQESVKQYVNPQPFIKTLLGYDGQPINVLIQQDVNEFFNLITDKLEKDQKNTKQELLIPQVMGGILVNQFKSLDNEIEFSRESEEPFLTVTIEIKHKKCLEEALDLFIKADILDGENKYYCDEIKRKIDAQKRCYFKKLPNTFIFTLKRFEFDYNTMLRQKVNDYFEFPESINMFKWTRDHLIEDIQINDYSQYEYTLSGVLVHQGYAEGGHYYSFIKNEQNKWFEFNDKYVTPFKFENLKEECFGGFHSEGHQVYDWDNTRSKTAYLLFYEKTIKEPINSTEGSNELQLKNQVIFQNSQYLKNQLFYSQEYLQFVKDFITQFGFQEQYQIEKILSYSPEMTMFQPKPNSLLQYLDTTPLKMARLYTLFIYETLLKNKNSMEFSNSIQDLINYYDRVPPASFWLLDYLCSNRKMINDILFESSYNEVRSAYVKLLTHAISIVFQHEEEYFFAEVLIDNLYYQQSNLYRFLKVYCEDIFQIAKKNIRRSYEYFQVIKYVLTLSQQMTSYFFQNKYYKQIYQTFTETLSENMGNYGMSLHKINEKGLESSLSVMCEAVGKYILGCRTQGMLFAGCDSPYYLFKSNQYVDFDSYLYEYIFLREEFRKFILPMTQLNTIALDVTRHLCWNDLKYSEMIMSQLIFQLLDFFNSWQYIDPIFHIIFQIVQIKDDYSQNRVQMLFAKNKSSLMTPKGDSIVGAIKTQLSNQDRNFAYNLIGWMAEIASSNTMVELYFKENKEELKFMLTKAQKYRDYSFQLMYPLNKIEKSIRQLSIIFEEEQIESPIPEVANELQDINDAAVEEQIQRNRNHYTPQESGGQVYQGENEVGSLDMNENNSSDTQNIEYDQQDSQ